MDETRLADAVDSDVPRRSNHLIDRDALARRLRAEEPINALTHAIGLGLSVLGAAWLMTVVLGAGDGPQIAACAVYGSSLVAVYAASTLSHIFSQHARLRRVFRVLDQAFIFTLIAGTFTPIAVTYLRDGWGLALLAAMWTLASLGFLSKTVLGHQIEAVTTAAHVGLGWLPVLAVRPMIELAPRGLLWWVLAGGLCYTAGTFFLNRDARFPRFHAIWHVLVIAGSACHYVAVLRYCVAAAL
jgi:hemolysin III